MKDSVGFTGEELASAMSARLDADPNSEEYKKAYKCIWRVLTSASMQKIQHGKNLTLTPALGVLWDEEGHEEDDIAPGTFAELLRYGSVHFEQTRESIEYREAQKIPSEMRLKKGVLEP